MKTTDVYVEQLLLGLLVLFTGALFVGQLPQLSADAKGVTLTFQILAAAYLLGILYDRFADTLFQNLEQHSRLTIAIDRIQAHRDLEGKDPFPEEELRLAILEKGGELAKYADYLRSRIRLSRAMAAIVPALSVGFAVYWLRVNTANPPHCDQRACPDARRYVWLVVIVIYALVFLLNLLHWPKKPPRTDSPDFDAYLRGKLERRTRLGWYARTATREPALLGAVVVIAVLGWVVSCAREWYLWLLPWGAVAGTAFAGWVWYRINLTHLTLLRICADKGLAREAPNS